MKNIALGKVWVSAAVSLLVLGAPAHAAGSNSIQILRDALFGAGVGAISAEVSGGKAGKGALIGAGTQVLGSALLGLLTGSSQSQPAYAQPQPSYAPSYTTQQPVYQQPAPVYYSPAYEDPNKRIIKQGLMGAGVGAISAGASGGKAGSGALIGAGTNVIGGALLELLTN